MPEDLVSVAQSLVPEILSNLDRIDEECQLPPELADRMAKHRLFSLYAPRELGGPELDPLTAFRVVETISHADGSAASISLALRKNVSSKPKCRPPAVKRFPV